MVRRVGGVDNSGVLVVGMGDRRCALGEGASDTDEMLRED